MWGKKVRENKYVKVKEKKRDVRIFGKKVGKNWLLSHVHEKKYITEKKMINNAKKNYDIKHNSLIKGGSYDMRLTFY